MQYPVRLGSGRKSPKIRAITQWKNCGCTGITQGTFNIMKIFSFTCNLKRNLNKIIIILWRTRILRSWRTHSAERNDHCNGWNGPSRDRNGQCAREWPIFSQVALRVPHWIFSLVIENMMVSNVIHTLEEDADDVVNFVDTKSSWPPLLIGSKSWTYLQL